jgi:hypothetical protein
MSDGLLPEFLNSRGIGNIYGMDDDRSTQGAALRCGLIQRFCVPGNEDKPHLSVSESVRDCAADAA